MLLVAYCVILRQILRCVAKREENFYSQIVQLLPKYFNKKMSHYFFDNHWCETKRRKIPLLQLITSESGRV